MRYRRYGNNNPSKMTELISMLGPMVNEVKAIFLNLSTHDLDKLLDIYSSKHGKNAANYARKSIYKWRSGSTKMSGKTAERLLDLVPAFIPLSKRHEFVSTLCNRYKNTRNQSIEIDLINPSPGVRSYHTAVDSYKSVDTLKHLPSNVTSTLKWLSNDDIIALRAILAELDKVTANKVADISIKEFSYLNNLINTKDISSGTYQVKFPNGTLTISFKQPSLLRKIYHSLIG